jgi:hypothetical protein
MANTNLVTPLLNALIAKPNQSGILLSNLFSVGTSAPPPTYLDVIMTDRIEYSGANSPLTGTFTDGSVNAPVYARTVQGGASNQNLNIDEAAIVFTYQAATGQYYNAQYGYFNQLTFKTGNTNLENAEISVYTTNSYSTLYSLDPNTGTQAALYDAQYLASVALSNSTQMTYCGSVDVLNTNNLVSIAAQATPLSVVQAAKSFVGQVWNEDGCWVLASDIATLAGASLPVTSMQVMAPIANNPWIVAYYGGNQVAPSVALAESLITAGDIVAVAWAGGGAHIFTVVSGSGASAKIIDNAVTGSNGAHDGYSADVIAGQYFTVGQEFTADVALASSITIYRLDTPTIAVLNSTIHAVSGGAQIGLSTLFSCNDANGAGVLPITEYAFYSAGSGSAAGDVFAQGSSTQAATSSASALLVTADQLSTVSVLTASGSGGADTIYVSAYNGSYWGDWVSINLLEAAPTVVNLTQPNANYHVSAANLQIQGASTGINTVSYSAPSSNFEIAIGSSQDTVVDLVGANGTDLLSNISRLSFTDTNIALDTGANQIAGNAYLLYQAAFNRTPDTAGLGYWISKLDGGANIITGVAENFILSSEFQGLYGASPTMDQFTNLLYTNVLHRAADAAGLQYWETQFASTGYNLLTQAQTLNNFAISAENQANVASQIAHGISYQAYVG